MIIVLICMFVVFGVCLWASIRLIFSVDVILDQLDVGIPMERCVARGFKRLNNFPVIQYIRSLSDAHCIELICIFLSRLDVSSKETECENIQIEYMRDEHATNSILTESNKAHAELELSYCERVRVWVLA